MTHWHAGTHESHIYRQVHEGKYLYHASAGHVHGILGPPMVTCARIYLVYIGESTSSTESSQGMWQWDSDPAWNPYLPLPLTAAHTPRAAAAAAFALCNNNPGGNPKFSWCDEGQRPLNDVGAAMTPEPRQTTIIRERKREFHHLQVQHESQASEVRAEQRHHELARRRAQREEQERQQQ
jgi:hypothetical protein